MNVIVTARGAHEALLDWGHGVRRAAVGRSGIGDKLAEGDGMTPIGTFAFRRIFYRADRLSAPHTKLPVAALAPDDGWCDAPVDPHYNMLVKRPYPVSSEELWRTDHIYDLIVVIGFNDDPVVRGKGSAIFLHIARPTYSATAGCVAIKESDLLELLPLLGPHDTITIRV
jgi:L,D-peptidoglycan transpeptidase YkuD (ErfK/YbiS/YcfS/YnhG family)